MLAPQIAIKMRLPCTLSRFGCKVSIYCNRVRVSSLPPLLGANRTMPEPVRILVVEDEAVVLHTLELILEQRGYDVRVARNGTHALSIASSFAPNILLCDINLPEMDGIQISIKVKRVVPDCRIVLLTGDIASTELLEEAERHGYRFEVLAKPMEPHQLLRVLAGHDGSHRDPSGIHLVK
jgi:CheY-like chemotaxis protein